MERQASAFTRACSRAAAHYWLLLPRGHLRASIEFLGNDIPRIKTRQRHTSRPCLASEDLIYSIISQSWYLWTPPLARMQHLLPLQILILPLPSIPTTASAQHTFLRLPTSSPNSVSVLRRLSITLVSCPFRLLPFPLPASKPINISGI